MNEISACIIYRDGVKLEKAVASVRPYVKEVVIVDTGSTPEKRDQAAKLADQFEVFTSCNDPVTGLIVDFSAARNRSFDRATQPWVLWLDADDEVSNGEKLAELIKEGNTLKAAGQEVGFMLPYEYQYNDKGECILRQYRERLFSSNKRFRWVGPVHEVSIPVAGTPTILIMREDVVWKHMRQYGETPSESGRNLRILRNWVTNSKERDPRTLFYFGTELVNNNLLDEGITILSEYVEVSGWDHEQYMACDKLVQAYVMKHQVVPDIAQKRKLLHEALRWAFKGIELREDWAEGYLLVSKLCYFLALMGGHDERRNWERCIYFAREGLSKPPTKTMLFINPLDREFEIYVYLNVACNKVGDTVGAFEAAKAGLKSKPTDGNLLMNKGIYEAWLTKKEAIEKVNHLRELAKQDSRFSRMGDFELSVALAAINDSPLPRAIQPAKQLSAGKYNIVFACGDAWEEWNPDIMKTKGIGGSETAVVEMSKRLAAKGHSVSVYTSCGEEKTYDGVSYRKSGLIPSIQDCDVYVAWRNAPLLPLAKAKTKLLWVHDIWAVGADHGNLLLADRVIALSEWHKQFLANHHKISLNQIYKSRNGIDLKRFNKTIDRNPLKAVYSSSADRGLPSLLSMWPKIRKRVPVAELHLFYGFYNWKKMAESTNETGQLMLIRSLESQIEMLEPWGVKMHGRVDQQTLANHFMSAGVWIYPTWFTETSCITAMEAQAAGLYMVTSPIAALNETVGDRGTMIPGDWLSSEYQSAFIEATVTAMNTNDFAKRASLHKYAKDNFSWDGVVSEWEELFGQLLKEAEAGILTTYKGVI